MLIVIKIIVLFIVATIPLLFATVQPWVWSVYSVLIFAAFLLLLWQDQNHRSWMSNKIVIFTVVAFLW